MERLQVYADFDWLDDPVLVGTLSHEMLRGTPSYGFSFDTEWLRSYRSTLISGDLMNFSGDQYKSGEIFGCFGDAMPDRWGKRLIDKRERIKAEQEKRIPRTFTDYDYLIQLDDFSRMGAFRFKYDDAFVGASEDEMRVPPLTSLREFVFMAHEYERNEQSGKPMREEWLDNLFRQGSSLGGARPKANVMDENSHLCIAKIPSVSDDYDIALWEHFAHVMAKKVGINAAETRLLKLDGVKYHTLLSRRFDRTDNGRRRHFASALTLANLKDGDNASTGHGYLDIVDVIIGPTGIVDTSAILKELYRRVAFSICIGNHDDHFRNHGFLLGKNGWQLSPAYDLNPTNMMTQSLLISSSTNESSLDILLDACEEYMIDKKEAEAIIREVKQGLMNWRIIANQCQIPKSEQERFAQRFSKCFAH
ncbi:MAG: HipA domain-containing protein [Bacteroidales bacterium]|nr:HipA domain-containing protein [Bacteroidales bacterium]